MRVRSSICNRNPATLHSTPASRALRFHGRAEPEDDGKRIELSLNADLAELQNVLDACQRFADHHMLDMATASMITLAIEELVTNVITHGLQDSPSEVAIYVRIVRDAESVIVTVEDTATPFNPVQAPEPDVTAPLEDRSPGGLGVHLVMNVMDEVEYEAIGEKNVVRMRKWIR